MGIRILLVEDDEHIRNTVKTFLNDAGYSVDICADGDEAHKRLYENVYQLVILDIMLPGISGLELLKEVRKLGDTPVLMMTALADDESQLRAFNAEADDYVTKPFKIQLFMKRVEALLRRSGSLSREINYGKFALWPEDFKLTYNGEDIVLTLKEFQILLLLIKNKDRTLSHEVILSRVWGYDFDGDGRTVHTHIKNLRAKLPENIIKTVRGVGYRLEEENHA